MSHHGPFQPDPFWDSVKINSEQVMDIVSVHFVFFFFFWLTKSCPNLTRTSV